MPDYQVLPGDDEIDAFTGKAYCCLPLPATFSVCQMTDSVDEPRSRIEHAVVRIEVVALVDSSVLWRLCSSGRCSSACSQHI